MGLDTTHGCWRGAYSAFMRWRRQIAFCCGIPLDLMEGFFRPPPTMLYKPAETALGLTPISDIIGALPLSWGLFRDDPITILLNHSDCEGEIKSADCAPLADRLEGILDQLPEEPGGGHIGSWQDKTNAFISGLREAAASDEDVEFS